MEEGSIMKINRKLLTVSGLRELLMIGDGSGMIKAWQRDGKERPLIESMIKQYHLEQQVRLVGLNGYSHHKYR